MLRTLRGLRPADPIPHRGRRPSGDAGGLVVGWAVKLLIVFAVVGIPVIDGVRIAATHLTESDDVSSVADKASQVWQATHSASAALQAAEGAAPSGETVVTATFKTFPNGAAYVELRQTVSTILIGHIGPLKKLAVVTEGTTVTDQSS